MRTEAIPAQHAGRRPNFYPGRSPNMADPGQLSTENRR